MFPYIPFANSRTGCDILKTFYPEAAAVRVTLDLVVNLKPFLPNCVPLWLDTSFEAFSQPKVRNTEWKTFIEAFPNNQKFEDPAFLEKPSKTDVQAFVDRLMNECIAHGPARITIPQWPVDLENPKFKLNRTLSEAAMKWRANANKQIELILPVVFTHQQQLADKAARTKSLSHIKSCLSRGQFEGIWSVDSSLADQDGTGNFDERFKCIIKFFDEVRDLIGPTKHITAGPHWGLNLVLWARGQIDHPAIGLGSAYQYHVHGGINRQPNTRVALSPLRRWATHSAELKAWLVANEPLVSPGTRAQKALSELQANFAVYGTSPAIARKQIAQFYRDWFHLLHSTPAAGRALALYQDLSSAYVLGKNLKLLPKDEKTARRPERVAQQLMLHCL